MLNLTFDLHRRFWDAIAAQDAGDIRGSIAIYEEILQQAPESAPVLVNVSVTYFLLGHFNSAEKAARDATILNPSYDLAFFNLACALDELGRIEKSIAAYRRCLEINPGHGDAHYGIAHILNRHGDRKESLSHWQTYMEIDPQGEWHDRARAAADVLEEAAEKKPRELRTEITTEEPRAAALNPVTPRSGLARWSIFDCTTHQRVSRKSYSTPEDANHDYHMNAGHTYVGVCLAGGGRQR